MIRMMSAGVDSTSSSSSGGGGGATGSDKDNRDNKTSSPPNSSSSTPTLIQIENEVKAALRLCVMLVGCRAETIGGAENMLSAVCQTVRMGRLAALSTVLYLRQHSMLANRALQMAEHAHECDTILDFLIHKARPISVDEISNFSEKELKSRMHTISVLFFSLSRQLSDRRAEAALMQQIQ